MVPGFEVRSENLETLTRDVPLARGLGRAYGDAALPARGDLRIAGTRLADRVLHFDPATADLTVEAGYSLDDLCRNFLPRGFFTPVTPGTRFVTAGGMVACDVHGKNHHRDGSFGQHVSALRIRVGGGDLVTCSPVEHQDLFHATIGGMGLTGAILDVTFRLARVPSPWIYEQRQRIANLDAFLDALGESAPVWPMTVGWIDCLTGGGDMGRGVLYCGRWAQPGEAPAHFPPPLPRVAVPVPMPPWVLSSVAVRAFNAATYARHPAERRAAVIHPYKFFYPLDSIEHWPRLYGRRGFTQYQCVIPESAGREPVRELFRLLTGRGGASFLCVIKDCGPEGAGMLSFPRPGISIALDIPIRQMTQSLVDAMNERVIAAGGRIYLAKDALTRPEHYRAMEPRLERFLATRRQWDPQGRIRSAQSVRLFGW